METTAPEPAYPWLMLISRSGLFLLVQLLIALVWPLAGVPQAWGESSRLIDISAVLAYLSMSKGAFQARA